jgi:hypothetical protein
VSFSLTAWSAWAPGLAEARDWRLWAAEPEPLGREGVPDVGFLPPMLRRRCTPLSRIMLKVAFACCEEPLRGEVRTVFASRHGSINESIELLENVVRGEKLSPTRFSHTVHNAQAGLFSIAAGNRQASSSLSAQEESFGCALIEALAHRQREPGRPVLLVMADVPLSETFAPLVEEPACAYGVALLLAGPEAGAPLSLRLSRAEAPPPARGWPDAAEFLRFILAGEPRLALASGHHRFDFERLG